MDAATLNDIGITIAGIVGIIIFYRIGKSASRSQDGNGTGSEKGRQPETRDSGSGADAGKK